MRPVQSSFWNVLHVDFGILIWSSSAFCFGPPSKRMGTLMRASARDGGTRWMEIEGGIVRRDPQRLRVRRRHDGGSIEEVRSTSAHGAGSSWIRHSAAEQE